MDKIETEMFILFIVINKYAETICAAFDFNTLAARVTSFLFEFDSKHSSFVKHIGEVAQLLFIIDPDQSATHFLFLYYLVLSKV